MNHTRGYVQEARSKIHKLLTPGPVSVHPRVAEALMGSIHLHHRSPAFARVLHGCFEAMRGVFGIPDSHALILLPTSGTGITEAMMRLSLNNGACLILSNGEFGKRLGIIAKRLGIEAIDLHFGIDESVPLGAIEKHLLANRHIKFVYMVHHETSMGRINDYQEVLALCRRYNVRLGVDMVSSWGAEAPVCQADLPDIAVSVSGKAIGAFPGLAFAVVDRDLLSELAAAERNEHFLAIERYHSYWMAHGNLPFTPPVQVVAAFYQALLEIEHEGLMAKRERHQQCMGLLKVGLEAAGFTAAKVLKPSITTGTFTYQESDRDWFDRFYDLIQENGFLLLQNPVTQKPQRIFQGSAMGYMTADELRPFLALCSRR